MVEKIPEIIGDIEIDLEQHDVLLTARFDRPALFIDGNLVYGVEAVQVSDISSRTRVVVTFNELISSGAFPLNNFNVLQTWLSDNPEKLSLRDIAIKMRLSGRLYPSHQKSCYEH